MSILKVDTLQHRDGTEYILSERNKLINGDFSVAQRGTSLTSTDSANNDAKYTLDRWQLFSDGNDVVDVTQETTTVPTNQLYAIALDVETANKKFGIAQKIEQKNCVDLIGQEVTLSFKAKVSATTNLDNVKCAIIAWDGTADSLTDDMISAWGAEGTDPTLATNYTYENTPANLNLTTSYATYTTTATIDTSGAKNVVVFIWSDVTTTSAGEFLYITDVQLEKSPSNSTFERKSFAQQLFDCQRYYQRYATGIYAVDYTSTGYVGMAFYYNTADAFLFFSRRGTATMRTTPSNETSSADVFNVIQGGTSRNTTNIPTTYNNANINMLRVQTGGSATDESVARVVTNTDKFFAFSAEL
jgi:hypothetical protein